MSSDRKKSKINCLLSSPSFQRPKKRNTLPSFSRNWFRLFNFLYGLFASFFPEDALFSSYSRVGIGISDGTLTPWLRRKFRVKWSQSTSLNVFPKMLTSDPTLRSHIVRNLLSMNLLPEEREDSDRLDVGSCFTLVRITRDWFKRDLQPPDNPPLGHPRVLLSRLHYSHGVILKMKI